MSKVNLIDQKTTGVVEEVHEGIAHVSGIKNASLYEVVLLGQQAKGLVIGLSEEDATVLVLARGSIKPGTPVRATGSPLTVPVGIELFGKNIHVALLASLKNIYNALPTRKLYATPSPISQRERITKMCETGVRIVDTLLPIGKGQRELVIGNRKVGKTSFALQVLSYQEQRGTVCIYTAIGKQQVEIKRIEEFLHAHNLINKTIMVSSSVADPSSIIYITPFVAMTLAEFFKDQGNDVLLILDDLTTHAKFFREIALVAGKFPGRNSYPGDIFYQHARLLEGAGNFKTRYGTASITCLPIADTVQGELSGYIQTNLMSTTDGHLFFDSNIFARGQRPAINILLSVTRVGRQTQSELARQVNNEVTSFMSLFEKLENYTHFGAELSQNVRSIITLGQQLRTLLEQSNRELTPIPLQLFLVGLVWGHHFDNLEEIGMKKEIAIISQKYMGNPTFQMGVEKILSEVKTLEELAQTTTQIYFSEHSEEMQGQQA